MQKTIKSHQEKELSKVNNLEMTGVLIKLDD